MRTPGGFSRLIQMVIRSISTVAQKCNVFLQITTFFYKSQLFSTNHNFFLQSTTFFFPIFRLFSAKYNFFFPILRLFSTKYNFVFSNIATFFYKPQLFSPILRLFSTNHNFFLQYCNFSENTEWIASAESRSVRGASHQRTLMGGLFTIAVAGSMVVVAPSSHRGSPSPAPRGSSIFSIVATKLAFKSNAGGR